MLVELKRLPHAVQVAAHALPGFSLHVFSCRQRWALLRILLQYLHSWVVLGMEVNENGWGKW